MDRNIGQAPEDFKAYQSPSSRRAWIEILRRTRYAVRCGVALLAEGVDRNRLPRTLRLSTRVALLAEGVDRNVLRVVLLAADPLSPSSRRAWIEMMCPWFALLTKAVALLAEGVDRNAEPLVCRGGYRRSPSSRRAWIEI